MKEKGQQQLYYYSLKAALLPHTEETNSYEKAAQVSKQKCLLMTVLMSFNEDFCTVVKWSHHNICNFHAIFQKLNLLSMKLIL